MTAPSERSASSLGLYRAQKAEELLSSLVGVISARVVVDEDGDIEEIHVLSSSDVSPKQAVRNVESALRAHLDLAVDHRRISVAQAAPGAEIGDLRADAGPASDDAPVSRPAGPSGRSGAPPQPAPMPRFSTRMAPEPRVAAPGRVLFLGHRVTSQRAHRVETRVSLEWNGQRYEGTAWSPDLPKARLEAMAEATLRAMEAALREDGDHADAALTLEGVRRVEAFDRQYVLVSVHAVEGSRAVTLAGAVPAGENTEVAVVLATLQATDRRIRGMIEEEPRSRSRSRPADPSFGDPFDIWG